MAELRRAQKGCPTRSPFSRGFTGKDGVLLFLLGRIRARHLRATITALLLAAAHAGCEPSGDRPAPAATGQVTAVDDAGREVTLPAPAERVVSLLPAGTETLFAIGAGDVVVGRTRYDVDPHLIDLPSVGGGLDPSLEALVALRPDLVLAFETASESRIRHRIEQLGIPVFAIKTEDTTDIYRNIERLGTMVGRDAAAAALRDSIRAELREVSAAAAQLAWNPTAVYVASIDPAILAGGSTYIGQLIGLAGGEALEFGELEGPRWPQVSLETLVEAQPDVVILPVGADPTSSVARLRREPGWRELRAVQEGRIAVVPTDLMSRPGPGISEIARVLYEAFAELAPGR